MQAIYNFNARNNRELSLMKGEMVQVKKKIKFKLKNTNALQNENNIFEDNIFDILILKNVDVFPFFCQVVNKAKQWWLVRNSHGEEGNVPLNILEPASSSRSAEEPPVSFTASPPPLHIETTPQRFDA